MGIINDLRKVEEQEGVSLEESLYFKFLITKKHFLAVEDVIKKIFPIYTLHDHRHAEAIINNLSALEIERLMGENPLNKYELFLLNSAAYLHDIGMIEVTEEDKKESKERKMGITDIVRIRHHERSFNHILKNRYRLFLGESEARNLAIVCKGHRKENLYKNPQFKSTICPSDPTCPIRLDLLAGLLRIGDELDISYQRVENHIKEFLEGFQTFDLITQLHWFKHYYTIGPKIRVVEEKGLKCKAVIDIEFQIPTKDYKTSFIIPFVINPIKKEIDFLQKIFLKYGLLVEMGESIVRLDRHLQKIPPGLYDRMVKFLIDKVDIRILVVDDEKVIRDDLVIILKKVGYKVHCAENCRDAIEKMNKYHYHLVLIDLQMPDLRDSFSDSAGIELLRYMKDNYTRPAVYIIITVLPPISERVVNCLREGAYDFIEKDWPQSKIRDKIERAIRMNYHLLSEGSE